MPITLGTSEYESARKLVDTSLTADQLPDTTLALDAFGGAAVRWVETRTSNADDDAKMAAVYKLASIVLPAFPRLLSESNAGYSYSQQQANIEKRVAQLLELAEDSIARSEAENPTDVGTAYGDASQVKMFDVAPSGCVPPLWWERRYPSA
jgi:hypothetical protein